MVNFFLLLLSFFGWKRRPAGTAPANMVAATGSPPTVRPRIRTEAQQMRDADQQLEQQERIEPMRHPRIVIEIVERRDGHMQFLQKGGLEKADVSGNTVAAVDETCGKIAV